MERCKLGPLTRCLDYNSTLSTDTELQQSVLSIMMVLMGSSMRRQAVPLAFMQLFELGLSRHVSGQSIVDWLSLLGLMACDQPADKHAREFARRGGIRILLTLMRVTHLDLLIHVIRVLKALASTGIIHGSDFSNANKRQVVKFLESCKIYRPPSAALAPAASIPALPSDASRPQPRRIQVADYEETVERKETLKVVQNAAIRLFDVAADPSKPKPECAIVNKAFHSFKTKDCRAAAAHAQATAHPAAQPQPSAAAKPKPSVTARVSESQKPKPEDPAERARREWDAFVERVRKCLVSLDSEQFFLRVDAAASLRKLLAQREVTPDLCAEVAAKLNPRLDDEDQVIVHSCSCIVPMASKPDRRLRMAEAGTLPLLVKTLLSYNTTVIEHGLKAIAQFASDSEYIEWLLNCGLLRHLSVILNNSNESVSSNARIVVGHLRRLGGNKVQVEIDLLQSASVWDRVFRDWKHQ
ncbi:hypothetical protein BC831DRAFT_485381 [Entophlyctis helioformis]|nr:hypothetical protein BC831DRAFT_485381 [Entophlyctis helioformis]